MESSSLAVVIPAGGGGTRLWPRSRRAHSKQVLRFFGERSLIQQTVDRLRPVIPADRWQDFETRWKTIEGLEAAVEIRHRWPGTAVIVLSQHVETEHLFELLAGDARGIGYVLKERVADIAQFTAAIRRVAAGESVIDPQVVARLVARPRQDGPLQTLTERELAVLALMAEGRSNQAIAGQLFMSPKTVETHVGNMFTKLGLLPAAEDHRRVLAVLTYLRG